MFSVRSLFDSPWSGRLGCMNGPSDSVSALSLLHSNPSQISGLRLKDLPWSLSRISWEHPHVNGIGYSRLYRRHSASSVYAMKARHIGDWSACGQGFGAVLPCLCLSKSSLGLASLRSLFVGGWRLAFSIALFDNHVVVCVSFNLQMGRLSWYW
jgi:hypothetical protein